MLHVLFHAAVAVTCCGPTQSGPCPCAAMDTVMAFACGCASCPPGWATWTCSTKCQCVGQQTSAQGVCQDGPNDIGQCLCSPGWTEDDCNKRIPYITKMQADSTLFCSYTLPGKYFCRHKPYPFQLAISGGHFGSVTSAVKVFFIPEVYVAPVKPDPVCSVVSSNDTHILCDITFTHPYPSARGHVYNVFVEVGGVSSNFNKSHLSSDVQSFLVLDKTSTDTETLTLSLTPSLTLSESETHSLSSTESLTETRTQSLSMTPSLSATLTNTLSLSTSSTGTATTTPSLSETLSATVSATATASVTRTASATSTSSNTDELTATVSLSPTVSETPTGTMTPTTTASISETLLRIQCLPLWHHPPHCNCGPWHSDVCDCTTATCTSCHAGWFGPTCTSRCPSCVNGKCSDGPAGTGQCVCDMKWHGTLCNVPEPVIADIELEGCFREIKHGNERYNCRHPPPSVTIIGSNFAPKFEKVTASGTELCRREDVYGASMIVCFVDPLGTGRYDIQVVVGTQGNQQVASAPIEANVFIPTVTETFTLSHTPSLTNTIIPVCGTGPWNDVDCTCDGAVNGAVCGQGPLHSYICVSGTCKAYQKCVHGVVIRGCLCTDAPDGALCDDAMGSTADDTCSTGTCAGVPICNKAANITSGCTCTNAAKYSTCNSNWMCDGNGACAEYIEALGISVAADPLTPMFTVPVRVTFVTNALPADDVSVVVNIASTGVQGVPGCTSVITGNGHTILTCHKGDLSKGHVETFLLYISAAPNSPVDITVVASLHSLSVNKREARHEAVTTAHLPLADLQLRAFSLPVAIGSAVPSIFGFEVLNLGPAAAEDTTVTMTVKGSTPSVGVTMFSGGLLHAGGTYGSNLTVLMQTKATVLSLVLEFKVSSSTADPNKAADVVLSYGPVHLPPLVSRHVRWPLAKEAFHPLPDPAARSMSLWPLLFYVVLLLASVWVVTAHRAPKMTEARLLAHTTWNLPVFLAPQPLPSLDRLDGGSANSRGSDYLY